jgi:hypothetical protein
MYRAVVAEWSQRRAEGARVAMLAVTNETVDILNYAAQGVRARARELVLGRSRGVAAEDAASRPFLLCLGNQLVGTHGVQRDGGAGRRALRTDQ